MPRLRHIASTLRQNPVQVGLTLLLMAMVVLAIAGSGTAQIVGFVGGIIVLIACVGGVPDTISRNLSGAGPAPAGRLMARGALRMKPQQVLDEAPVDENAWAAERSRRELDQRS